MTINKTKTLAGTVGVGKLLFTSLASAGKSDLGVKYLNLDMAPVSNLTMCYTPAAAATIQPGSLSPTNLTITNPFPLGAATGQMSFSVSNILPNTQGYVVFLAYSPATVTTPVIATPLSTYPLLLDLAKIQILASYSIPAITRFNQTATSVGTAQSTAAEKLIFTVDLSSAKIATLMSAGTTQISLQVMMVPAADFNSTNPIYTSAILSPVNTISFAASCPTANAKIDTDSAGGKTSNSGGSNSTSTSKSSTGKTSSGASANTGKTSGSGSTCTQSKSNNC